MLANDTVRLVVQFRDFNGYTIEPTDVTLKIFGTDQTLIETITTGIIDNAQGNYHYDYVATDSDFIYEYSGLYNEKPVLARQLVQVKFN